MDDHSSDHDSDENNETSTNTLQQDLLGHKMRMVERRLIYLMPYTMAWTVCVCLFKSNIVLLVMGAVFMVLIAVFNLKRAFPRWKVTFFLYIIPVIGSFVPYIS